MNDNLFRSATNSPVITTVVIDSLAI